MWAVSALRNAWPNILYSSSLRRRSRLPSANSTTPCTGLSGASGTAPHRSSRAQEPYDPVGRPLATANARKAALLRRFGPTCRLTGRNIV